MPGQIIESKIPNAVTTCPWLSLFNLLCLVVKQGGTETWDIHASCPCCWGCHHWNGRAKVTSQVCLEGTKDFLWCQAACNNPNGGPKMHISDVSYHYQAIIISSFEESACQSLWHAFSFFQWYMFFFCFFTEKVFDRLSSFQCLAVCLDVLYCKAAKSLQHQSENENILTSSSLFLYTWALVCSEYWWGRAGKAGSWWLWNVPLEMGWPEGGKFQPGFGIQGNFSKLLSDMCREIRFSCVVRIFVRKQENILTYLVRKHETYLGYYYY